MAAIAHANTVIEEMHISAVDDRSLI